jgi:geranylgeranyl pyrophosphate synthase
MKDKKVNLDSVINSSQKDLEKKIADMILDKEISLILEGGKRLRPLLAHLSFKACTQGKETPGQYQKALEGGVVIELAHAASLVHDDIIDNDKERRGKPSFFVRKGIGNAILTGHKMLATGFNIALRHGKEVAKLYIESWNEIVNGEIDEVDFNKNDTKNIEISTKSQIFQAYNKIIDLKTAALFSSASKAGAIEANMSGDILKVFADYGREIGLAYQLADDLVDLTKGEMIESVIVPLLNRLDAKITKKGILKKRNLKKKFVKNKDKIQEIYFDEIKRHVKQAEELGKSDLIPVSPYKDLLRDAPSYIINRMLAEINLRILD